MVLGSKMMKQFVTMMISWISILLERIFYIVNSIIKSKLVGRLIVLDILTLKLHFNIYLGFNFKEFKELIRDLSIFIMEAPFYNFSGAQSQIQTI